MAMTDGSSFWSLSFHAQQIAQMWQYEFMRAALVGAAMLGALGGYLAVYVVLRRVVFLSVALSECSAVGLALALMGGVAMSAVLPYSVAGALAGVLLLSVLGRGRRLPAESVVGAVYAGAAAVSILVLALAHLHESHEVRALLWGDVLTLSWRQVRVALVVFAAIALAELALYKEFLFCSFDPEMARTVGLPVTVLDILFFTLLGITIPIAVSIAGLLVAFAYLVLPGVVGLLLARRMGTAFLIAAAS
ncbi:MAG: metal ABC transporter permease, partial [Armatimonadetes bacterium]|nr:metal ABC transporter permease [Armatimonadota bacterium]